jgi:hypothetical protein
MTASVPAIVAMPVMPGSDPRLNQAANLGHERSGQARQGHTTAPARQAI